MAQASLPGQVREESTLSAGQNEQIAVKLYPNPAVEYLNVSFDEPIAKHSRLTVHNIIGNVLDVETETIDDHEIRVRVKDLPVGYYLLAIRDEQNNSRSTLKFLKR
jgi:hypothetical protein